MQSILYNFTSAILKRCDAEWSASTPRIEVYNAEAAESFQSTRRSVFIIPTIWDEDNKNHYQLIISSRSHMPIDLDRCDCWDLFTMPVLGACTTWLI